MDVAVAGRSAARDVRASRRVRGGRPAARLVGLVRGVHGRAPGRERPGRGLRGRRPLHGGGQAASWSRDERHRREPFQQRPGFRRVVAVLDAFQRRPSQPELLPGDVRPPADQHDHGDDRRGARRARRPDRAGSGPQRRRLRQRQPRFLPGPLRHRARPGQDRWRWAPARPECTRGSTSSSGCRVPRWSASPRSADAPAAPEASSCWPATCASPRARTRCSASSRSARAWSPAAVRWPGSLAWSAAAARSRSSSSPTTSTDRARSSTGTSTELIADDRLDDEVDEIASRLARFDHDAIARTKSYVDQVTLPADSEFPPALADFFELSGRPASRQQFARLEALGLNTDSDLERSLGRRVVESLPDA